ncbi:GNAT family N-acetyltransferase [Fredinandcohnia quinoae]|uniref:GNAT family N-acetyltransferase n=1 Tax=Fredinandcohnia quinoae TaxID=2918902 RepID=A0AAW5DZR2_9BACI|nr:GNAT family protein [Fredinandcohnia sp. SECRCQ15]MCH1623914.1 GNAT family N-acetyltransferase [Fredinandcohnia sp. SECRCQ15]
MIEIFTEHLLIVPCSLDIAKSLIFHRNELEQKSPITIPKGWPSALITGILPLYIEEMEIDNTYYGWGLWIIINYEDKQIIGDIYIQGKPDNNGTVHLCFNMSNEFQNSILTYEAVDAMIEWLTTQTNAKKVITECCESNFRSIQLFEKLGMRCTKKDGRFLMWELKKAI